MSGAALIVQGDALRLPLPDACVDLVVTSPPYAFLRAYDTGYPHLEIGAEATPAEFLEHLWQATTEMVRVLKPTGSIFVDLGDKYNSAQSGQNGANLERTTTMRKLAEIQQRGRVADGIPAKSLMLLPERYRIGCVDQLGLIARAVIIWDKPNGLPESVTDRVRRSHEDWVHLTKQPRYYSAIDEVREPHSWAPSPGYQGHLAERAVDGQPTHRFQSPLQNPLGKLPGSVWSIASEPLSLPGYFVTQDGTLRDFLAPSRGRPRSRTSSNGYGLFNPDTYAELVGGEDAGAWRWLRANGITSSPWPQQGAGLQLRTAASHYAAFPTRWPEQLIKGFSPPGICLDCEQGRIPVVERHPFPKEERVKPHRGDYGPPEASIGAKDGFRGGNWRGQELNAWKAANPDTILGYACACTPYTNHPGSGGEGVNRLPFSADLGHNYSTPLRDRPKVGPWREYHLDGWTPPPTRPAVVLDPFSGVGTTIGVARRLGRIGIGVDLSHSYCRAAKWRVFNSESFGKAQSRTWVDRQGSLL